MIWSNVHIIKSETIPLSCEINLNVAVERGLEGGAVGMSMMLR